MTKFFEKFNFTSFKTAIINTAKRMPLSVFLVVLFFSLIIVLIKVDSLSFILEAKVMKAVLGLGLSFFFSIGMYLYTESKGIYDKKKCLYQSLTIIFLSLFYYFFEENLFNNFMAETAVYIALSSLGVISFLFIASFILKIKKNILSQNEFYLSSYELVLKTLMSAIVGFSTMFLGFIAFTAIFTLFDIDFASRSDWFSYWSAFSLALFAPMFFLVNLPKISESAENGLEAIQENKFYSFLIKFIGVPAIYIYFLILYSYALKVLINFKEWPHGEVTWLVILFSFVGYIMYFASYAFRDSFSPAQLLRKYLPAAVFLQTFMLFYAIGLRINQYDITINRYLVLVFGFWLFALSLYYIFSKKKSLAIPFYSLLILVIFISIGPWSVYTIPEWRQLNNLEKNLLEAGILQDDLSIKYLDKYQDIDSKLSGEIYGGISYLANNHGYESLNKFFKKEIDEIKRKNSETFDKNRKKGLERALGSSEKNEENIKRIKEREYRGVRNWEVVSRLSEKIKVKYYSKNDDFNRIPKTISFINNEASPELSMDISGYDYLAQVSSDGQRFDSKLDENELSEFYGVQIDIENNELNLYFNNNVVETFQIGDTVIKSLLSKKDDSLETRFGNNDSILLPGEDMSFDLNGKKYDLKLVLRNISIANPEYKQDTENTSDKEVDRIFPGDFYSSGYALIKKK